MVVSKYDSCLKVLIPTWLAKETIMMVNDNGETMSDFVSKILIDRLIDYKMKNGILLK